MPVKPKMKKQEYEENAQALLHPDQSELQIK